MTPVELQPSAPDDTEALIAHIQSRYHDRHREDLASLLALARRVESVHGGDPDLPPGLGDLIEGIGREMEAHMAKEEGVLFPLMLQGGHPMIVHPISAMRHDHDEHGDKVVRLTTLTQGFVPPAHACGSWRRLYAGLAQFAADLERHMHLENDVLFPRFERQVASA